MPGDHIKKTMQECTGAEMFAEALYHWRRSCHTGDPQYGIVVHVSTQAASIGPCNGLPARRGSPSWQEKNDEACS